MSCDYLKVFVSRVIGMWKCHDSVVPIRIGCAFVLSTVFSFLSPAFAVCVPQTQNAPHPNFLEQLVKHTPKDRPLTDKELLDLMRSGDVKIPPFVVFPPNGPTPLVVELRWSLLNKVKASMVEIDLEGNGFFRPIDGRFDPYSGLQEGKLTHTYERVSTYRPTLRVRDEQGQVFTYAQKINVKPTGTFVKELQSVWADFKTALMHGNVEAAVDCTHASAREKYKQILPEVLKSGTPISEILQDIEFVKFEAGRTEFRMLIHEGNDRISYMVLFQMDEDELWRIKFF